MQSGALALARREKERKINTRLFIFKVQSIKLKAQVIIKQIKMERASFFVCYILLKRYMTSIAHGKEGGKKEREKSAHQLQNFFIKGQEMEDKVAELRRRRLFMGSLYTQGAAR